MKNGIQNIDSGKHNNWNLYQLATHREMYRNITQSAVFNIDVKKLIWDEGLDDFP